MDLRNWKGAAPPSLSAARGRWVAVTPFNAAADADDLFAAIGGEENDDLWEYIPIGPFRCAADLAAAMERAALAFGWVTHLIRESEQGAVSGMASYMRIRPEHGSAEVGCIVYSKALQRTPAATEAMYLMMRHVLDDLGYRRYEWKCNNANAASKRAAERLGFQFEGVFRNDMVVKGKNRDTAWYSITNEDWPRVKAAMEAWLAPENFDGDGKQQNRLEDFRRG